MTETVLPAGEPRRRRSAGQAQRRRRRQRWTAFALAASALFGVTFVGGLLAAPVDFAVPAPPQSALLLDHKGRFFASIKSPEAREEVPSSQIPDVMRQAIVAAEDERFLKHSGVDPVAVGRAALRDLTGSQTQGGSTITQQYVKNVYVGSERTWLRKMREAALAVRLERKLPKDVILTRYLNGLYLGNGTYGVQAASKYYFGIPVSKISLAQASMLAGIAPAPSVYNPVADLRKARERQRYTLNRMVANGMITSKEASDAFRTVPRIVRQSAPATTTVAPEFADYVEQQLKAQYGKDREDDLYRGGLKVTTTLDLDLQESVVQALKDVLPDAKDPEAAVVAIDPRTGDIRAMATKRDGGYKRHGLNLATDIRRNSGSTIKPFTLAAALMNGHTVDEGRYAPAAMTLRPPGQQPFFVRNSDVRESGYFTLRTGMWSSVNTLYAPLAVDVGLSKVRDVAFKAGLSIDPKERWVTPRSLGIEVSPISLATSYSTLASHGQRRDPRAVLAVRKGAGSAKSGQVVFEAGRSPGRSVIPAGVADKVADVLQGVVAQGTATRARQPFPVFGKTGTTENYLNAWFVGCSAEVCMATWMGYDKEYVPGPCRPSGICPHGMRHLHGVPEVFGGTLPAQVFAQAFAHYRERTTKPATPRATTRAPQPVRTRVSATPRRTPSPSRSRSASPAPTTAPPPTSRPPVLPTQQTTPPSEEPSPSRSAAPG